MLAKGNTLTQIITVQTPTYAVRDSLRNFLLIFSQLTETEQDSIFQAARLSSSLDSTVDLPVQSQANGNVVVSAIRNAQPGQTVQVHSHTWYGKQYDVTYSGGRSVSCTCPDYVNRSKSNPNHVCKHMDEVDAFPSTFGIAA
jgi:hypothetical protein